MSEAGPSGVTLDIRVANVRREKIGRYIGRATRDHRASPLGNPFVIGRDGARAEVIAKYEVWLRARIAARDLAILRELARLLNLLKRGPLTLLCWCAPEACHGDVVVRVLSDLVAAGVEPMGEADSLFGMMLPRDGGPR